ncbi:MAG: glycerophosphoryl diester phosphodiesterase membrane domain-containing protein [Microbacterium enclense]
MTAYPAWTPASRPGIVPLHPFGFGTILGRSFTALRHNPRVLLGFALAVQTVAYLVVTVAIAGVALASFSRLDTLVEGTDDYDAVFFGSFALTAVVGLVLGVAAGGLSVLVQGVVVGEVAHAVVAEKPTLKVVWRRVRPVFWRLIGYAALTFAAAVVVFGILAGIVVAIYPVAIPLAVIAGVFFALGCIPLYLWLATKLFLVPSVIILEGVGVRRGIARSWRLTRGRFWSTLGVLVIISFAFSVIAQIISFPLGILSGAVSTIVAPTGASEPGGWTAFIVVQLLGQAGILLVQSIALVVQSTSAVLVYVDARMRTEGLDHDLASYVDARDAGGDDLPDPYRVGIGRTIAPVQPWAAPGMAALPAAWGPPAPGGTPAGWGAPPPPPYAAASGAPFGTPQAAPPSGPAPATPPYAAAPPAPPAAAAPPYAAAPPVAAAPPAPPTSPAVAPADPSPAEPTDAAGPARPPAPPTTTWAPPGARTDDT